MSVQGTESTRHNPHPALPLTSEQIRQVIALAGPRDQGPNWNTSSSTWYLLLLLLLVSHRALSILPFYPKKIKETKLVDEVFCNAKVTSLRLRSPQVEVYCIGVVVKNISLHDLRYAHISSLFFLQFSFFLFILNSIKYFYDFL